MLSLPKISPGRVRCFSKPTGVSSRQSALVKLLRRVSRSSTSETISRFASWKPLSTTKAEKIAWSDPQRLTRCRYAAHGQPGEAHHDRVTGDRRMKQIH